MPGTPSKTTKASPKKPAKKKAQSRSGRAGLTMPVGRIARLLKDGKYAPRIGKAAPVFIAAVIEYLVAELVEIAGSTAEEAKKKRITPRYINLAIRNDEEFAQLLYNATISGGGVKPGIIGQLKKTKGKKGRKDRKGKKEKKRKGEKGEKKKKSSGGEEKKKSAGAKKEKKEKGEKGEKKAKKEKSASKEPAEKHKKVKAEKGAATQEA